MSPALFFPLAVLLASAPAHGAWGVAYGPVDARTPKPAIVFLHGMWGSPEDSCGPFESAATRFGFLVCPRGNAPLGEGRMWSGSYADAARAIHAAMDAAEALAPGKLDRSGGGTLVGYSNGAWFAAEVACAERGRWTGLVLLSMKLDLDATRLQAAGVRRIVLAAGDEDETHTSMQALARRLDGGELQARFMSLGPVGHPFPADMSAKMCAAVSWARGVDAGECGSAGDARPPQVPNVVILRPEGPKNPPRR
jgi:predicted esterase